MMELLQVELLHYAPIGENNIIYYFEKMSKYFFDSLPIVKTTQLAEQVSW